MSPDIANVSWGQDCPWLRINEVMTMDEIIQRKRDKGLVLNLNKLQNGMAEKENKKEGEIGRGNFLSRRILIRVRKLK